MVHRATTTFDLLNEPIAQTDEFGFVTTTLFDALGRAQATTDANSHINTTVFDSVGRTLAQVNALGYATSFSYDKRSSRVAVTNARGFTWTAQFDALARDYADLDPLGRRTTLAFDARSLVAQRTDGKGQIETRLYDALGRQTGSQYADGTIVTLTFDLLGRKLTEANQNGIWTRTYDALGQRLTELGPGYPSGMPLTSLYDAVGHRTALQCWRGVQTWGYDALHRPRTLVDIEGGLYTWSYEPYGRLSELDYPNGVIFTASYSSWGWPLQGSYNSPVAQVWLANYDGFDNAGNPLRTSYYWGGTLQNRRNLTYDAADQMTNWQDSDTTGPWTVFDPAGNPSTAQVGGWVWTYTYDGANEVVNVAVTQPAWVYFTSSTFSYDGNGCRAGEQYYQVNPQSSSSGLTTYTWDPAGHLLAIQQPSGGGVNLTHSYRPDGLRHQRTDSSGTTQILWDGDDLLAQVDTSGNLIEAWSWAPPLPGGYWSRLVKDHFPASNAHPDQYVHSDWRGTVVALSLPGGTALANSRGTTPRPWGDQESATLAPLSWLGSHGYWAEYQLGRPMHYVRARWYIDGGWLSPDPLGLGGGDFNLYRYVGNRPTVEVDPSGLWKKKAHYERTLQWAQQVYIDRGAGSQGCRYVGISDPFSMAEGAAGEDDFEYSAANLFTQWPVHFNWHGQSSWDRMAKGLSLNEQPDSRDQFFLDRRKLAIRFLVGANPHTLVSQSMCRKGFNHFGEGLHAIEDEFAHEDLSPAEHQDDWNDPNVDDEYRDRGEQFGWGGFYSTHHWYSGALNVLFGGMEVRLFRWPYDPSQRRMKATGVRVRALMCGLLRELTPVDGPVCNECLRCLDRPPTSGIRCP